MTDNVTVESGADLLDVSLELQARYEAESSAGERRRKGQVFTPPAVARFMARLLRPPGAAFRLLDPGAGVGILAAAACERLLHLRSPRRVEIHVFEDDSQLVPLLEMNLKHCVGALETAGHRAKFWLHPKDFVLGVATGAQRGLFDEATLPSFDAAIMNPPYFKIGRDSPYAQTRSDVVHGQPNIYALFMAQAADLLRPGGELVAITPRSFCNGLYFREFRRWYFERMGLERVHLFESRKETFGGVLQESVITAANRLGTAPRKVTVSAGLARDLTNLGNGVRLPARDVLDDSSGDMVVRIPASPEDGAVVELVDSWPHRFHELGLRISTGPVVLFRARRFARRGLTKRSVPLISVHNVRQFETIWPLEKNGKPDAFEVTADSLRLLVPCGNYVLIRRFSAKEERRRLVASALLTGDLPGEHWALENHLNYVYHAHRELSREQAVGVSAVFNSILFDRYFRVFSGNTQVNATEVRTMRFPDLSVLGTIGRQLRRYRSLPDIRAERLVLRELGVGEPLSARLLEIEES